MSGRTLVVAATNLFAKSFLVVPTDRKSPTGEPVNALFGVARALHRATSLRSPTRAIAVLDDALPDASVADLLKAQWPHLSELLSALGFHVVFAAGEHHLVASYARAAVEQGDDVLVVGVDKRFAQLVSPRTSWYDANKDVRYTPEIVEKRFTVPPARVAEWLSLVGDDSGNEVLPGVKGIGAKGATQIIESGPSIENLLTRVSEIDKRLGKALLAAAADVPRELARGRLEKDRPLPVAIDAPALGYAPPEAASLNAFYERLGFVELLVADATDSDTRTIEDESELATALGELAKEPPIAVVPLFEDPSPVRVGIAGLGLSNGSAAFYVASTSSAWRGVVHWLEDATAPKTAHDLVSLDVELRRASVALAGVVGDSAAASHLTEPSGFAPHDLTVVAKHVLGRAIAEEDAVRGVGKQRKAWSALPARKVADQAGALAGAAASIWRALSPKLDTKLLLEALEMADVCVRMELTGLVVDVGELDSAEKAFAVIESELERDIEKHRQGIRSTSIRRNSSEPCSSTSSGFRLRAIRRRATSTPIEALLERIEHRPHLDRSPARSPMASASATPRQLGQCATPRDRSRRARPFAVRPVAFVLRVKS